MTIVLVSLAASALLGLATGLVFKAWANAFVALLIALTSATALAAHGFQFWEGVLVTAACLFVSQLAYFVGVLLESGATFRSSLSDDLFNDEPDDNCKYRIDEEKKQRRNQPSRPSPPEA